MKTDKLELLPLLKKAGLGIWRSLSHNLWYKLLSVLIAVILWSYVFAANPTISRNITVPVEVTIAGQPTLGNNGLALLTDLYSQPITARVYVRVPQSSYNLVTSNSVRADLDLSSIRHAGKQQVQLKGYTTYGTALQVSPETIEVEVESRDERYVPVNPKKDGVMDDNKYWYNLSTPNPSRIMISGPASLVRRATQARVTLDMTGFTEPQGCTEQVQILDAQNNEIIGPLEKSSSSATVQVDIYPYKLLPVSTDIDEILTGELPKGYTYDGSPEVQPGTIQVAANQVLLDSLTSVSIEPIDVTGHTRTFTTTTRIKRLPEVKNYSSESVTVTVNIIDEEDTKQLPKIAITQVGLPSGFRAKLDEPRIDVTVTGPMNVLNDLHKGNVRAEVDLSEITQPGSLDLPIQVYIDGYPELACKSDPTVAHVTITAIN